MTTPNTNNSLDTNNSLEATLKDLLDKMLNYFEKFIQTKEDLQNLEGKLNDYENLAELVDITKNVFNSLVEKIDQKLQTVNEDNYAELEKVLQKHESEIRNHIRIEQQLKLYTESIQSKLEDAEKARNEVLDETKALLNESKKDNVRLSESIKLKAEEIEKLQVTIKNLEEQNRHYELKLHELPHLQERVNHLEKRQRKNSLKPPVHIYRDTSQGELDLENYKKVETEVEESRLSAKPDSARKSLKAIHNHLYTSPMKLINKTLSTTTTGSSRNAKEYVKIKIDGKEIKQQLKDSEALRLNYKMFYNPAKSYNRERERDRSSQSKAKARELKSIYSIPLATHSSNSSLVQLNQNFSHRDHIMVTKVHQRSNSHGGRKQSKSNFLADNGI